LIKIEFTEYISELLDGSSIYYKHYRNILSATDDWDYERVMEAIDKSISENPKDN